MNTIRIPKTDAVITTRNKREERAARHFLIHLDTAAMCYADNHNNDILTMRCENLEGEAEFMYWLKMIGDDAPFISLQFRDIVLAMAADIAVEIAVEVTDEDDEAEQYMDSVKADAAYCLGIEYGSDEWYALAEI